jgi:hypothetical protein
MQILIASAFNNACGLCSACACILLSPKRLPCSPWLAHMRVTCVLALFAWLHLLASRHSTSTAGTGFFMFRRQAGPFVDMYVWRVSPCALYMAPGTCLVHSCSCTPSVSSQALCSDCHAQAFQRYDREKTVMITRNYCPWNYSEQALPLHTTWAQLQLHSQAEHILILPTWHHELATRQAPANLTGQSQHTLLQSAIGPCITRHNLIQSRLLW